MHDAAFYKVAGKNCSELFCERCLYCNKGETIGDDATCRLEINGCLAGYASSVFPGGLGCRQDLFECQKGRKLRLLDDGSGFECIKIK